MELLHTFFPSLSVWGQESDFSALLSASLIYFFSTTLAF